MEVARDEAGKIGRGQRMKGLISSAAITLYPEANVNALKGFKSSDKKRVLWKYHLGKIC